MPRLIKSKSFTEIVRDVFSWKKIRWNVKYMLKQANLRLERLSRHWSQNAQIIRHNKDIQEIKSEDVEGMSRLELASLLARLNKFTQARSSTISGYRETRQKTIDSFHESGYEFVNEKNLDDFLMYMDTMKESVDAEQYGSDDLALYYEQAQRLGIETEDLMENLDLFQDNFRQIEKLDVDELRRDYGENLSSMDIQNALGLWK